MKQMKLRYFHLAIAILIMLGIAGCVSKEELNAAIMGEYECAQVIVDGKDLGASSDCWLRLTDIGGHLCLEGEEYDIQWYYTGNGGELLIDCSDITRHYNATYQINEIRLTSAGKEYVFSKR